MKLLHIDSSILGENSVSRKLSAAIVEQLKKKHSNLEVDYLDLGTKDIPHLTGAILLGQDVEQSRLGEELVDQYLAADIVVIGAGMYNFSIPSNLKAWVDRIAVAGKTFKYTAEGAVGLATNIQKAYIASSRGGIYGDSSPADFQEAFLKQIFNFTGVTNIEVFHAEGVNISPELKEKALQETLEKISHI
ncbi:FMN-dependent NADH-azoreductase [Acinetobacter stercoris]|uniref:FMN dependent NADH:quinone oxidoreductase n=1 Tax=Acinetobacter stercoris TaxID=2126983 RepID=A0A2U3MU60_9GAMM|nr:MULTISPECIES: NAD(P)H-dependent oxidoreductase [Acinetobacter]SPL68934.1 FMN-dependent NADH-azoreductase 1 [Acinetobacter stercoris]